MPISNTVMSGHVPGATDLSTGDTSHQVALAGAGDYALTFEASNEPIAIDVTSEDGTGIVEAIRYRDLVLPPGVAARLLVGSTTSGTLAYDADSNGTFETSIPPTASASGAAAADVTPPVITFGVTEAAGRDANTPNIQSVTVAAQDPDSGVQSLFYSLDGLTYQPVTGTIGVDPDVTPVVYAFADDQLANRAASQAFHVPNPNKPDLAIAMSHPGPVSVTGTLAYTVVVTNTGNASTTDPITVVDSLPLGTSVISAAGSGWTCIPDDASVTCTHAGPAPASGALPGLALTLQVSPDALPAAVNEATVETPGDWNPGNDYALDESPVQREVDLALEMTSSDLFPEGGAGSYTLTVTNLGSYPAVGFVTITDSLPAGLTFGNYGGEGWNCTANGQDLTCDNSVPFAGNGGALPPLVLSVYIDGSAYPSVVNDASVSSTTTSDTDPSNNSVSVETFIDRPAAVSLFKSHVNGENPRPFQVGTNDFYDLTVSNAGLSDASGPFAVVDTLPSGLTYVSATGQDWSCSSAGQQVTCNHPGPLPAYNSLPSLQLTVDVGVNAAAIVTNTATVSFAGLDPSLADNTALDPTRITRYSDLGVTKSHSGTFVAGGVGDYTIGVTNYGPDTSVGGVEITDNLPQGMTLAGYSGMGWTCSAVPLVNSDYVTCINPDSLPINASYPDLVLSIAVSASSPAQVTNRVYMSAHAGYDTDVTNNDAADPTTIDLSPPVPEADLSAQFQSVSPDPARNGMDINYALSVFNAGPDVATNTVLTNRLPSGVVFTSVNPSSGSCTAPPPGETGTVVCTLGSIGSGQGASVLLTGNVSAAPHTSLTSVLSVTSDKTDPDPTNNSATQDTEVAPVPCQSLGDGSWQSVDTWSCSRVPLPTDDVEIFHRVTLDANSEVTDVTLQVGSELVVPGNATLNVHGNWSNSGGVLTPGSGAVIFDKNGRATLRLPLVLGGVETFCHVQVGASTLLDTGDDALAAAAGCAVIIDGAVSRTTPFAPIDGATPATLADGASRQAVRVTQQVGSNDLAMIGVTVVAHQAPPASQCGGQPVPGTPVLRTYDVNTLAEEGIQATLRLYFDQETEANGTFLDRLHVYHCDGGSWASIPGPTTVGVQGGLAYVEVSGVTAFSPFALAQTEPLAVTVASFDATALSDRVELVWETASEMNNAGFNLYRNTTQTIPSEPLAFVPSQAPGSGQGAAYSYEDADVAMGVPYWYWLEGVDLSGATTLYGPVSVTVASPTAVALTGLQATSEKQSPAGPVLMIGLALVAAGIVVPKARRVRRRG